jgi:NAD-dependent DNA ligase
MEAVAKNIVFTGAATDRYGKRVCRKELTRMAEAAGFIVQPRVTEDTDWLIANRFDTAKARKAEKLGVAPWTPRLFIKYLDSRVSRSRVWQQVEGK